MRQLDLARQRVRQLGPAVLFLENTHQFVENRDVRAIDLEGAPQTVYRLVDLADLVFPDAGDLEQDALLVHVLGDASELLFEGLDLLVEPLLSATQTGQGIESLQIARLQRQDLVERLFGLRHVLQVISEQTRNTSQRGDLDFGVDDVL